MACSIQKLSPELLEQILVCMDTGSDEPYGKEKIASAYSALSRSSKKLYPFVTPYLYQTFTNFEGDRNIPGFVKTVCKRPDIAEVVEKIEAGRSERRALMFQEDFDILANTLSEKLADRVLFDKITAALAAGGCYTARLMVLLSACLEVREFMFTALSFDYPCWYCQGIASWLHDFFSDPKVRTSYKQLQQVVIREQNFPWERRAPYLRYGHCLPILHFPALRSFTADSLGPTGVDPTDRLVLHTAAEPSQTLTEIRLLRAFIGEEDFARVVSSSKVLTTLRVDFEHSSIVFKEAGLQPPRLLSSLLQHQEHLEELILTNVSNGGLRFHGQPALGSLVGFTSLRHLTVDEYLLRGLLPWQDVDLSNILPACLESLTVHTFEDLNHLDVGRICNMLSTFKGEHLATVQVTFHGLSIPSNTNILFPDIAWAPNEHDLGSFSQVCVGPRLRLVLTYCNKPEFFADGFAGLASLLIGTEGEDILEYMISKQAPFSLKESGSVVVYGVGSETFVQIDSDWLWRYDLGLEGLFEEE